MTDQLLGLAELAELYGVTKATASNWSRRHTFPQPHQHLKMGPVWLKAEVVAWKAPNPQPGLHHTYGCAWCGCDRLVDIEKPDRPEYAKDDAQYDLWHNYITGKCPKCHQRTGISMSWNWDLEMLSVESNQIAPKEDA